MSFPFDNKPMPQDVANAVYDILVAHCHQSNRPDDRDSFVLEYTEGNPSHEYRLGIGGKFRYPRMTVDGYIELSNPKRDAIFDAANAKLSELKQAIAWSGK